MSVLLKTLKWSMLALAMHCGVLSAQMVQYGRVVEMNSGGKALSGVSITIQSAHDCQPTSSDINGMFRLSFGEHKVGDVVLGLNARKYGYEVVNHHLLREGYTLTDKDSLRVVMAPVGKITEARMHYYALLEAVSVSRYDSTMSFLNQQFAQKHITEPELEYWKSQAEQELKTAYQNMDDYADRLARINRDDLNDEDLPLYDQLLSGDVTNALALIGEESGSNVINDYLVFSGTYPMMNPENHVADGSYDLLNIPDSLYSDVMVLDNYTQHYETDFSANGPRYAESCYYLGVIFDEADNDVMAAFCFRKALKMYELLTEMEVGNYNDKIAELKEMLKRFE